MEFRELASLTAPLIGICFFAYVVFKITRNL